MDNTFIRLKYFLEDTNNFEELLESDTLIWVDHREYDEDIISYVNEKIFISFNRIISMFSSSSYWTNSSISSACVFSWSGLSAMKGFLRCSVMVLDCGCSSAPIPPS